MIVYKIDVLKELKDKGYSVNYLMDNKIFGGGTITLLKNQKPIKFDTLDKLCYLLGCNVEDIITFKME